MTPAQAAVWQRVSGFDFDEPGAAFPFSRRVARENAWTPAFTRRAIDEYRKFAFLAVATAGPVSPSPIVDEVWHEHLLYTRNYWQGFCASALGRPLHHEPTRGGAGERAKFAEWYASTLARYREFFGEPPQDIWPRVLRSHSQRQSSRLALARWLSRVAGRPVIGVTAAATLLLVAGCAAIHTYNPLDFRGPQFLTFWLLLVCVAFGATVLSRRYWPQTAAVTQSSFDPIDAALLAGGEVRAVEGALAVMARADHLTVSAKKLVAARYLPSDIDPLQKAIHAAALAKPLTLSSALAAADPVLAPRVEQLKRAGLLIDREGVAAMRWSVVRYMGIPLLLGAAKIAVGISRDRPVGFLVVGMLMAIAATWMLMIVPRRTRAGDDVLQRLQEKNESLQATVLERRSPPDDSELYLSVALFGAAGPLAVLGLVDLQQMLGAVSDSSSSCSGSSCGSGCGGGGGCGGGCGGCGA